ncbi:MAG: PEP/pyruvate-binding domain-containing protein [Actinomycetota bacterium]
METNDRLAPPPTYPGPQVDGAVLSGASVAAAPRAEVGGKAANLAAMAASGLPVPPFFVVTSPAFTQHVAANAIPWPDLDQAAWVAATRQRIRTDPVPGTVATEVTAAYLRLVTDSGREAVAVRSSAAVEDGSSASFAGQFSSVLNVSGEVAVLAALRECWASSLSDRSLAYRSTAAAPAGGPLPAEAGFAVVIQTQIDARSAGVLFTVHPVDPDSGTAYLEANFGTGESVVGGLVTPDGLTLSREGGGVVDAFVARKRRMTTLAGGREVLVDVDPSCQEAPVLTDDQAAAVLALGLQVETLFGVPQDVEWAYDDQALWLLQARPITTLPTRPGGSS